MIDDLPLVYRDGALVAKCTSCFSCLDDPSRGFENQTMTRFIVCPTCGNKRCPKATHHDNACTGSNEPGQEGSRY